MSQNNNTITMECTPSAIYTIRIGSPIQLIHQKNTLDINAVSTFTYSLKFTGKNLPRNEYKTNLTIIVENELSNGDKLKKEIPYGETITLKKEGTNYSATIKFDPVKFDLFGKGNVGLIVKPEITGDQSVHIEPSETGISFNLPLDISFLNEDNGELISPVSLIAMGTLLSIHATIDISDKYTAELIIREVDDGEDNVSNNKYEKRFPFSTLVNTTDGIKWQVGCSHEGENTHLDYFTQREYDNQLEFAYDIMLKCKNGITHPLLPKVIFTSELFKVKYPVLEKFDIALNDNKLKFTIGTSGFNPYCKILMRIDLLCQVKTTTDGTLKKMYFQDYLIKLAEAEKIDSGELPQTHIIITLENNSLEQFFADLGKIKQELIDILRNSTSDKIAIFGVLSVVPSIGNVIPVFSSLIDYQPNYLDDEIEGKGFAPFNTLDFSIKRDATGVCTSSSITLDSVHGELASERSEKKYSFINRDEELKVFDWLISDTEFVNADSLTKEDITLLCQYKNPDLVTNHFDNYIYEECQLKKLNPKVLLATLKWEQNWGKLSLKRAFGVGPEGNPGNFTPKESVVKATDCFINAFMSARTMINNNNMVDEIKINADPTGVSITNPSEREMFKKTNPKYWEFMKNGIVFRPINAAMYAKLRYTPWLDFPYHKTYSLDNWHNTYVQELDTYLEEAKQKLYSSNL